MCFCFHIILCFNRDLDAHVFRWFAEVVGVEGADELTEGVADNLVLSLLAAAAQLVKVFMDFGEVIEIDAGFHAAALDFDARMGLVFIADLNAEALRAVSAPQEIFLRHRDKSRVEIDHREFRILQDGLHLR